MRLTDSGEEATLIFAELLVILRDRGWLRLDEGELTIESGLAIYVPPHSLHQLKAESDVELLWIAWRAM
ncbi:AraC family ligand binding domain-containing protein [Candidatus Bathyarchaeota archaeon]|nr:AraC family ligand binding domain-containing protein [Candidatus Bathyarchaeota archaeon]